MYATVNKNEKKLTSAQLWTFFESAILNSAKERGGTLHADRTNNQAAP